MVAGTASQGADGLSQREALSVIERQAHQGVNLTPRLSKSILDPEFSTTVFLDDCRRIHHLHQEQPGEGDGFVERGGPLLFVMKFDPETMFLVDLRDHDSFADDELLQIVHDNCCPRLSLTSARQARCVVPCRRSSLLKCRRKARKCPTTVGFQAKDRNHLSAAWRWSLDEWVEPEVVEIQKRIDLLAESA